MSSRPPRKPSRYAEPPRRSRPVLDEYQYKRKKVETFYDEDQDYHFAEALEDSTEYSGDWFREAEGDTIDKMSEKLDDKKRKAVRWRVQALRGVAIFNVVALVAGALPTWVLMLVYNRASIAASKEAVYCDSQYQIHNVTQKGCVYYYHEMSTFTAFVGLWLFGTLLQSLFMTFTSWKLHNKSFQAVVSLWTMVFMTVGLAVVFYTTTTLTLMDEPFNWRVASKDDREADIVPELKTDLITSIRGFLSVLGIVFTTQLFWLAIIRQVLQYGIDLEEFGSELCGDDPEMHGAERDRSVQLRNMEEANMSKARLLADDEFDIDSDPEMEREDGRFPLYGMRGGAGPQLAGSMGEFEEYDDENDEGFDDGNRSRGSSSSASHPGAQPSQQNSLQSVMDLMTNLTATMSALHNKIDAIESRVGDGTALLVMPPGENQWDAKKPSS